MSILVVFSQSIEDFKVSSIISIIESNKMNCTDIVNYFWKDALNIIRILAQLSH